MVKEETPTTASHCTVGERIRLLETRCADDLARSPADLSDRRRLSAMYATTWVDRKHGLLLCLPPKAGCTTWKAILANNSRDTPLPRTFDVMKLHYGRRMRTDYGLMTLAGYNESERRFFLHNYYKILLVRHPLERFVSAYVDKLSSGRDVHMQRKYGAAILSLLYPNMTRTSDGRGVTLSDFIAYIRLSSKMNAHWASVNQLCLPCQVRYNLIMKTETLDADSRLVIMSKMAPYFRGSSTRANSVGNQYGTLTVRDHEKVLRPFANVSLSHIAYLLNLYRKDFAYFGYDFSFKRGVDGGFNLHSYCRHGSLDDGFCC